MTKEERAKADHYDVLAMLQGDMTPWERHSRMFAGYDFSSADMREIAIKISNCTWRICGWDGMPSWR